MTIRPSSVEILLSTDLPEPYDREFVILPLSSGEDYIAGRGLPDRFRYYFNREPDAESGLMAVYNFLSLKIDKYRSQAMEIGRAVSEQYTVPREYRAQAVASVMVAQAVKKTKWPTNKRDLTEIQNLKYQEAVALSPEAFGIARRQAASVALENGRYWIDALTKSRADKIAEGLREAIDESDHSLIDI